MVLRVLWSHRLCGGEGPGRRKVVKKTFEAPIPEFLHSKREVTLGDSVNRVVDAATILSIWT